MWEIRYVIWVFIWSNGRKIVVTILIDFWVEDKVQKPFRMGLQLPGGDVRNDGYFDSDVRKRTFLSTYQNVDRSGGRLLHLTCSDGVDKAWEKCWRHVCGTTMQT